MRKCNPHIRLSACLIALCLVFARIPAQSQTAADNGSINLSKALRMVMEPDPVFQPARPQKVDPAYIAEMGFEQVYPNTPYTIAARDGKKLFSYRYASEGSKTAIILLHGVLSSAFMMNRTAGLLREATGAEVFAADIRGHGRSEGKPGDVSYIGQYVDDIADLIAAIHNERPGVSIILAGHSMGGGICLQYALQKNVPDVDGYLLLAPHLGHNSPAIPVTAGTSDTSSASGTNAAEAFLKIHITRIIGLKLLNDAGDHRYDSLPVLFFNVPKEMPVRNYSWRANESMAPADYKTALGAVNKPLLVLVGSKDEAFVAAAFEPAVRNYSKGRIFVIEGATHNGIRHNTEALQQIRQWANTHQF